ncbi:PREDICTED: F-box protein SKP2B-like [Camelina sativa]|uniref:F-box protein SKP2B-like n=1 Tax=Camelina sativa TaxID=90675 RepID=A0ABM1QRS7_CAMSA|nr:PREDICTED: F-box protein SKP2B-like [Camelina sativa]
MQMILVLRTSLTQIVSSVEMDSMSLAYGCPDLRILDLCGCVLIIDESVVALANRCVHLRSLGLYYCRNITDRAMYPHRFPSPAH